MSKREVPGLMIKTLGDKLRMCRKTWTLKEVADRAEMSVSYLSDIECNRTVPSLLMLARLGAVYNQTVTDLLRDTAYDYLSWEEMWVTRDDDAAQAAHRALTGE